MMPGSLYRLMVNADEYCFCRRYVCTCIHK